MKKIFYSGITMTAAAISTDETVQIILLIIGLISAAIPVIKTALEIKDGKKNTSNLLNELQIAKKEIDRLKEKYENE